MDHFHMASWYYSAKQKQELLELEEEIMSDLFRNEESIERFSQFLEEKPYYHYPAIQSNFDYKYVAETLPTIVKWFADTSNYVQATTNQTATPIQRLEELMGRNYWAQLFAETGRTQELQQVRALNLSAAVNRSLDTFMRTLTGPILNEGGLQRFNTAVERYTSLAQTLSLNARAAFLFEIRQVGFVYLADTPLNMANTQKALNTLNNNLTSIRANRQGDAQKRSLGHYMAKHLNIPVYGFVRRSDYAHTWGKDDDRSYLRWQCWSALPDAVQNVEKCNRLRTEDEKRSMAMDDKRFFTVAILNVLFVIDCL